jgi:hypothetical protein
MSTLRDYANLAPLDLKSASELQRDLLAIADTLEGTNAELLWFAEQFFAAKDTGMLKLDSPADETLANVLARGRAAISSATP